VVGSCSQASGCQGKSFVQLWNLSIPGQAAPFSYLPLTGVQGEPNQPQDITSIGASRLDDGRYLLFVQGKDSNEEGWFYESDKSILDASTQWTYRSHWSSADGVVPPGAFDGRYQNTTLVTECGTGALYLVATGNPGFSGPFAAGKPRMDLFRLERRGDHEVLFYRADSRIMEGDHQTSGYCSFRAAAVPHVTPSGRLALYCSAHKANTNLFGTPDSKLKLAEYAR
jgi:hypothetical protein